MYLPTMMVLHGSMWANTRFAPTRWLAIDTIPRMNGKGKSGYCSFYRGNVLYERNEYDLMNADGGWHAYISW